MMLRFVTLLLLAALGGSAITVQAGLNAQVGRMLGHPLWATLVDGEHHQYRTPLGNF